MARLVPGEPGIVTVYTCQPLRIKALSHKSSGECIHLPGGQMRQCIQPHSKMGSKATPVAACRV